MKRTILLFAVLCLPGCMTIATNLGAARVPGTRLFSGTRAHIFGITNGYLPGDTRSYWVGRDTVPLWNPLDIPLSFVADIVMLPYTIPAQLAWGDLENPTVKFKKSDEEEKR